VQRYEKLYIITRSDLAPGLQAAQVAHAAFRFSYEHRPIATAWHEESNFLIILSVPDEDALRKLGKDAEARNLPVTYFTEPDIEDQLTAIAIAPSNATVELCAELPLALRDVVRPVQGYDTIIRHVRISPDFWDENEGTSLLISTRGFSDAGDDTTIVDGGVQET
jgi:peptidyl-tRNA hydrolase